MSHDLIISVTARPISLRQYCVVLYRFAAYCRYGPQQRKATQSQRRLSLEERVLGERKPQ
jgi:hypothetical protein